MHEMMMRAHRQGRGVSTQEVANVGRGTQESALGSAGTIRA